MLKALWIAVGVQLAGRLVDLRWHLTHDEFEGASQQIEAHWLLWVGVLATIAVAALALRGPGRPPGFPGYVLTLVSGLIYAPVAIWHFVEHANGADPELAHFVLAIGQIGMVLGAIVGTVVARRAVSARSPAASG
jgi:hypothetical protein